MGVRYIKIILVIFVGLQGWLYVVGNIANWDAAVGAIGYVLSMADHQVYSTAIFPAVTSPALVTAAFLVILTGEFLVGAFALKGAWDLWKVRNASAEVFNGAKTFALIGSGMAMVVWFGGFIVIGGALFQMWQTQLGGNSFSGAFTYAITSGLVMLIVAVRD